jgi:hypothetical protein
VRYYARRPATAGDLAQGQATVATSVSWFNLVSVLNCQPTVVSVAVALVPIVAGLVKTKLSAKRIDRSDVAAGLVKRAALAAPAEDGEQRHGDRS